MAFPGSDLRSGYGFGFGSAVQVPYLQRSDGGSIAGAGGQLKRSMPEMEMKHAIFLRSVKQRADPLPTSPLSSIDTTTSSILSSLSSERIPNSSAVDADLGEKNSKSSMENRLLELERHLLGDEEEEEEEEASISGSAVTGSEWSEMMQRLLSPPMANRHPLSPSPTTSSSSSTCSSYSCLPSSRQILLDTATAVAEGNHEAATANLAVLKRAANPRGDPEQRLTAMMAAALVVRIRPPAPEIAACVADVCSAEHQAAAHLLYEASPCFKLGLMAANLVILEATKDNSRIHILDFDVGQGGQLASLIHAITDRHRHLSPSRPPPSVKITAVCDPSLPFNAAGGNSDLINLVGDRLLKLADRLGLELRFSIVSRRAQELNQAALGIDPEEALAANFPFILSRIADESVSPANPRDELLRRVKALNPRVVAVVEQEMNGNTTPFAARFAEACAHYGPLLESLDATAARESPDRARVEAFLSRKATNCVVRDGPDRVERCEVYGKWRARMGMAGFQPVPLGPAISEPVKFRLSSLRNNPGFTLRDEAGWLGCGWMGRTITVASAWH